MRKWFAFGRGVGIEIFGPHGSENLRASAVRVRPNGARVLETIVIEDFPHQPAGVWGTQYDNFVRKLDLRYVAATVILPRRDVIVRQLALPGVSGKDLPSAVEFQMEGLHPYAEDDAVSSWARVAGSSAVLVAIARREVVERYAAMFAEAGVKIGCFTCSAAAIHSALRIFGKTPPPEILAFEESDGRIEFYGESPTRPLFSAAFEREEPRAAALACAELRIDPATEPQPLEKLLSVSPALPFAASLGSACPRLSSALNLLPAERRQTGSRAVLIPTIAFGAMVLLLATALAAFPGFEDRRFAKSIQTEIAKIRPRVERSAAIDRQVTAEKNRTLLLDRFRGRAKSDMDALAELTRILAPPVWINSLEIGRTQIVIGGEADQPAPLLKTIDDSPLFESSEFVTPPVRTPKDWAFRIRTDREGQR
ncbi:MAG: hypothetical protein ACRD30_01310 [Bryobacteraceae bacterium]